MVGALILVALGFATLPAFMSTRQRVWSPVILFACLCPVLMFVLIEVVKNTLSNLYGESLANGVGAIAGSASSLVVCAISAGFGLFRTQKLLSVELHNNAFPLHGSSPRACRRNADQAKSNPALKAKKLQQAAIAPRLKR